MDPAHSKPTPFDDGAEYDLFFTNFDYGLDFYLPLARAAAGPVLDLACGTGRILLPMLEAGLDVDGVDLFPGMLARLREKATARGFSPKLFQAPMSDFKTGRRYGLILCAFNAFVHNLTVDDQLACLRCCLAHLQPGGIFAFDTFFPGSAFFGSPENARVLEIEVKHPGTGLPVRMYDTRRLDRVAQIQSSEMDLEFLDASGNVTSTRKTYTTTSWIYKTQMELLLRLAGFARWEIYGGFDRHPLENETDLMVVEAWAR
jgi:SAM-dependent methyltransferase